LRKCVGESGTRPADRFHNNSPGAFGIKSVFVQIEGEPEATLLLTASTSMPLPVISFSTYLTIADGVAWRPDDYNVRDFVLAIKGKEIAGYASVRCRREWKRFESSNREDVVGWFGEMVAEYADGQPLPDSCVLVPIPGSRVDVRFQGTPRVTALAEAVAAALPSSPPMRDVLQWDSPIVSSRLMAGTRDVAALYRRLRLIGTVEGERVVLVDDVLTLGGHLRACAAKLRSAGADVLLGLCAARADQVPAKDPFAVRCEILSDFEP
jgi:hypothetical protein